MKRVFELLTGWKPSATYDPSTISTAGGTRGFGSNCDTVTLCSSAEAASRGSSSWSGFPRKYVFAEAKNYFLLNTDPSLQNSRELLFPQPLPEDSQAPLTRAFEALGISNKDTISNCSQTHELGVDLLRSLPSSFSPQVRKSVTRRLGKNSAFEPAEPCTITRRRAISRSCCYQEKCILPARESSFTGPMQFSLNSTTENHLSQKHRRQRQQLRKRENRETSRRIQCFTDAVDDFEGQHTEEAKNLLHRSSWNRKQVRTFCSPETTTTSAHESEVRSSSSSSGSITVMGHAAAKRLTHGALDDTGPGNLNHSGDDPPDFLRKLRHTAAEPCKPPSSSSFTAATSLLALFRRFLKKPCRLGGVLGFLFSLSWKRWPFAAVFARPDKKKLTDVNANFPHASASANTAPLQRTLFEQRRQQIPQYDRTASRVPFVPLSEVYNRACVCAANFRPWSPMAGVAAAANNAAASLNAISGFGLCSKDRSNSRNDISALPCAGCTADIRECVTTMVNPGILTADTHASGAALSNLTVRPHLDRAQAVVAAEELGRSTYSVKVAIAADVGQRILHFLWSCCCILGLLWVLLHLAVSLQHDINQNEEQRQLQSAAEAANCRMQHRDNGCDTLEPLPPYLLQPCNEWKACLMRRPQQHGERTKIAAAVIGDVLNSFFQKLEWRTVACLALLIIVIIYSTTWLTRQQQQLSLWQSMTAGRRLTDQTSPQLLCKQAAAASLPLCPRPHVFDGFYTRQQQLYRPDAAAIAQHVVLPAFSRNIRDKVLDCCCCGSRYPRPESSSNVRLSD